MSETARSPMSILIVEDHDLTRQGLAFALSRNPLFKVVGEAEDGQEAVELFQKHQPDVVLMDLGLPVKDGIEASQEIKGLSPQAKIVVLTSQKERQRVFAAFRAGANAYCMKEIKLPRLVQVIEMVMEGASWLDPVIAEFVLGALPDEPSALQPGGTDQLPCAPLTDREREVLKRIAEGNSNKEIAQHLNISLYTVKNHVCNIISKLAVDDRTQAAILAYKQGLI